MSVAVGGRAESPKHSHRNCSRLKQLGTALQFVYDILDRRFDHHVARGRVEKDRYRIWYGVAEAAGEMATDVTLRYELASQRRHLGRGQLAGRREQQWLDLGKVVAAAPHVDTNEGVALPH